MKPLACSRWLPTPWLDKLPQRPQRHLVQYTSVLSREDTSLHVIHYHIQSPALLRLMEYNPQVAALQIHPFAHQLGTSRQFRSSNNFHNIVGSVVVATSYLLFIFINHESSHPHTEPPLLLLDGSACGPNSCYEIIVSRRYAHVVATAAVTDE